MMRIPNYFSRYVAVMIVVTITPTTCASWIPTTTPAFQTPSSSCGHSYIRRCHPPYLGSSKSRARTRAVVPVSLTASPHKNDMEPPSETQPPQSLETKKNIQSGNVTVLDQGPYHVVVMKPPSVLCHHSEWAGARQRRSSQKKNPQNGNHDNDDDNDIVEIPMLQRIREALNGERVNLIHRLDRGASGCLLCAYQKDKDLHTTSALQKLMTMESSQHTKKTYIALVRGEGILHGEDFKTKGWFCVDRPIKNENGVENTATTYFRFVAGQDNASGTKPDIPRASLVLARPVTGRWHQIRKHLNGLSHPILGDSVHGNSRTNREWKRKWGLPAERTCLHLGRIQLSSPSSLESEEIDAEKEEEEEESLSSPTSAQELFPNGIDVSCPLAEDMLSILENHLPDLLKEAEPLLEEEGIFIRSKNHCQVLPYEIEVPPL